MKVSEIFYSIQGEGKLAGTVSGFIRLAGCPLRCRWCDTPYALQAEQGNERSIDEIVNQIGRYGCRYIVVTGGEPLIDPELAELLQKLHQQDKHITVETAGLAFCSLSCDLVSISPKLSNSVSVDTAYSKTQEEKRLNVEALQQYINHYDYQLKFVVQDESDIEEIKLLLNQLPTINVDNVMLMPQARTKDEYQQQVPRVVQWCIQYGFRFCPRLQIEIWGNQRGR